MISHDQPPAASNGITIPNPREREAMKQVLQAPGNGSTVVRDVPLPQCPPGGVLIQNAYSAISSGTERARVEVSQKTLLGKARARPDLVREVFDRARQNGIRATAQAVQRRLSEEIPVGYSSAGTVVEVGEHVRGLRSGDRVACGGATANHAEFVAVPANLCVEVPPAVPLETAAITTIAAIAMHSIRLADSEVGSRVAVIGCGLVGQIALRLLRAAGAEAFALDIDPKRVEQARSGGADHALVIDACSEERVMALTGGVGVDGVVVAAAASTSDPLLLAAGIARDRGSVVLVGTVPISVPRAPFYEKELRFRVSRSYGPGRYDLEYEERGLDYPIGYVRWTERRNMEAVLRLQAQGVLRLSDLVELVSVEQAPDAYARLTTGPQPRGALVLSYGTAANQPSEVSQSPVPAREAAPLPVQPAVAGQAARPRQPATRSPGSVRIGLIGPGSFAGRVLIPALKAAGADLVTVGGGSGSSALTAMRSGPFRRTAPRASAVVADPEVDAVVISTRHGSHAALASEALAAGKHVYCEKPLALTDDELTKVLSTAATAPGTLMVGFNRRFSALLEEARQALQSSGTPTLVYRVSAGKLSRDHWVHDLVDGGGRALGEVCHFIDSARFLAGSSVTEVHASGHGPEASPVQAWDNLVLSLRFANAGVASIVYVSDGSSRLPKERIEAFSGSRTAIVDDFRTLEVFDGNRRHRHRLGARDKGHRREVAEFLTAVRTGTPAIGLAEIENVSLATLAVVESLRTGRPVRIPRDPARATGAHAPN